MFLVLLICFCAQVWFVEFIKEEAPLSHYLLNYAPRHENIWINGSIAPRILNLGTRLR